MKKKRVKIRIALAVAEDGEWAACGASYIPEKDRIGGTWPTLSGAVTCHWLEADVEVFKPKTIKAKTKKAK